jgi:hypothetical protein
MRNADFGLEIERCFFNQQSEIRIPQSEVAFYTEKGLFDSAVTEYYNARASYPG